MKENNRFFVIGASHKSSILALREGLARMEGGDTARFMESMRRRFHSDLNEICVLSTCNRYEVYMVGKPGLGFEAKQELSSRLESALQPLCEEQIYVLEDQEAVLHLFRVASGLDSMVIGEAQIQGQVKAAYEQARRLDQTCSVLNIVFQRALAAGKRVRTETRISEGRLSVASVALELAGRIFADFYTLSVAVVGTGAMGTETARSLLKAKPKSRLFLSRTLQKAQELAAQFGGVALSLEDLPRALASCDVIITQLAAEDTVITREMALQALERRSRPLFILDIAVPRNVSEEAGRLSNVYLYNIDDLKAIAESNYAKRRCEAERARSIVEEEVSKFFLKITASQLGAPASL